MTERLSKKTDLGKKAAMLRQNLWEDRCVTSNWQSLPTVSKETRTSVHGHQKPIQTTVIQVCNGTPRPRKNTIWIAPRLLPGQPRAEDTARMGPSLSKTVRRCVRGLTSLKGEASGSSLMEIWTVRALLRRLAMRTESGSSLSGDTGKDVNSKRGMNRFF